MNQPEFPTPWQRKTIWRALTALAIATIFAVCVGFIYVFSSVMAFLQPILVPFAVAGVLAYLLEPVVAWLIRKFKFSRQRSVFAVFGVTTLVFVGILFWIIPVISTQTSKLANKMPDITYQVRVGVAKFGKDIRDKYNLRLVPDEFLVMPDPPKKKVPGARRRAVEKTPAENPAEKAAALPPETPTVSAAPPISPEPAKEETKPAPEVLKEIPPTKPEPADTAPSKDADTAPDKTPATTSTPDATAKGTTTATKPTETPEEILQKIGSGDWVNDALPSVIRGVWNFLSASLGGFLGFFGFLLSFVIVPLYLFYFLTESPNISKGWSAYLPLRSSAFKDEVVASITEINGYLIAFFRGQLVVSLINGTVTGLLLAAAGLDFGILIGFGLCFLGIIPYIGIVLCWIPAVIVASVQGGSWLVPADAAWWVFPVVVTGIFTIVQQVDGLFITPKVVGERVGLHPVTVIFSVFLWSLLLGGLLGAILAVPLTATLKVILKRYVWERTIKAELPPPPSF